MITYTVFYKKLFFWKKINNVKGDGLLESGSHRFFIVEDETRIEIPLHYEFRFSRERFFSIKENMEKESGKDIKTF